VEEEEPEDPELAVNTEEGLGELFSDEESEEEEEDPKAGKAAASKGKKEKTPLVIPDLPTFVPREKVVHEFCTKSKLKAREEAKKPQRKPREQVEAEAKAALMGPAKPLGPNGETQADLRAKRIAEREALRAEAAKAAEAKEAAKKAAKLAKAAAAAAVDQENVPGNIIVLDADPADAAVAAKLAETQPPAQPLGLKRAEPPVVEKVPKRTRGLR